MPLSNTTRRQPQDARVWKKSSKMDRRSALRERRNLGVRNPNSGFFDSKRLRTGWVAIRDRGDGDGHGHEGDDDHDGRDNIRDFGGDSDSDHSHGDFSDSESDFDGISDDEDDNTASVQPTLQPTLLPATSSSARPIFTLTALPTSQITSSSSISTTSSTGLPQLATPSAVLAPALTLVTSEEPSSTSTSPGTTLIFPTSDRKEEGDPLTSLPSSFTTSIQSTATSSLLLASPTASWISTTPEFDMDDNDDDDDGGKHKWHGDKNPQGGLDPTAEHLLIAAGAIGAFILFCFIGWIVYRVLKRSRGPGRSMGFIDRFRRKEPMEGTWDGRTMYMANEAPPLYEKGEYGTMQSGNYYAAGKPYPPGPGSLARSGSVASNSQTGTLRQMPNENPALASIIDQYQPSNQGTLNNNNINLTLGSQVTQPYYTQSDVALQPPDSYAKRVNNRDSELSSISSGFGDGDIIIPPPPAAAAAAANKPLPQPATAEAEAEAADRPGARDSWMSREGDRRETVYTTTSEDRPARFRSITSWVNQQAGRAKRAGSRARERGEVPVMPAVPGEVSAIRQTAYR
ncbi:hypothetical protein M426DRAFT_317032 [Hypoxylon sp. CI-4A]|nr:hypothetical protein M426DRAFT_317032 [Hypoxylon sp. CI-4A]